MPPGHRTLQNIYDMYLGINTINNSTRPNNAENGTEGKIHSCIL